MLFVKYVSDIYKEHKNALMAKYHNDKEMVERQMRRERFVLNEHSTFDHFMIKNSFNIGVY